MAGRRTELGEALEEGLKEALAWKRGKLALQAVEISSKPAGPISATGKRSVCSR